ncbi:MAG: DUF4294 domain-containing protein [Chitinophagaceae bacterium]
MKLNQFTLIKALPGLVFILVLLFLYQPSFAQQAPVNPRYGIYDTIYCPFMVIDGDTIPSRELEVYYVSAQMSAAMKKRTQEYNRLRNAVYVTFPYARKAGAIMNDINSKLAKITTKDERKAYLKSREKELKKEFTEPLTNLSIYQGRVLMKLINRQTGNDCYNIIKEYKGGITARIFQTVAFFYNSNLKQPYDAKGDDFQIELFVQEIERLYSSR